jgi:lipopolysaccharide assembly protein A
MRFICFLILVAAAGVVALFAYENQQQLTLHFFDRELTASVPLILGATYLLGMLSGWTVVGMLRRSWSRVTAPEREYANSR